MLIWSLIYIGYIYIQYQQGMLLQPCNYYRTESHLILFISDKDNINSLWQSPYDPVAVSRTWCGYFVSATCVGRRVLSLVVTNLLDEHQQQTRVAKESSLRRSATLASETRLAELHAQRQRKPLMEYGLAYRDYRVHQFYGTWCKDSKSKELTLTS